MKGNELKVLAYDILKKRNGFKLGDPWKFSKESTGVLVPILRDIEHKRDYVTLPEIKDKVEFEDLGGISPIKVKNTVELPIFIRSGTLLEGIAGQDRAVIHSIIINPYVDIDVKVRCVHASRPTSYGGGFNYAGYTPKEIHKKLKEGQGQTWSSIDNYYASTSAKGEKYGGTICRGVRHDDLPKIKNEQMKLDKELQQILNQVPVLENQVGAVIVGIDGVIGVELFDHPDSWKAQYKEAIVGYSEELAERAQKSLFKFDETRLLDVVEDFFKKLTEAKMEQIEKTSFTIQIKGYTGEFTINLDHMIHLFLMKNDEDDYRGKDEMGSRCRNGSLDENEIYKD